MYVFILIILKTLRHLFILFLVGYSRKYHIFKHQSNLVNIKGWILINMKITIPCCKPLSCSIVKKTVDIKIFQFIHCELTSHMQQDNHGHLNQCTRRVSGIIFIRYTHCQTLEMSHSNSNSILSIYQLVGTDSLPCRPT